MEDDPFLDGEAIGRIIARLAGEGAEDAPTEKGEPHDRGAPRLIEENRRMREALKRHVRLCNSCGGAGLVDDPSSGSPVLAGKDDEMMPCSACAPSRELLATLSPKEDAMTTDTPNPIEGLAQHMANTTLQVGDTPHWDRLNEDGRDIYRYEARAALDYLIAHFEARSEASDLMSESEWHNAVAGELRTLRGEP